MTEPEEHISDEEAKPHFERMLSTGKFDGSDRYEGILRILFKDRKARLRERELAEELGRTMTIGSDSLRPTIEALRAKLGKYNDESGAPVLFNISMGRYQLVVRRREFSRDSDGVELLLKRNDPSDPFEDLVCSPSEDVLLISIAMAGLFAEKIKPWFDNNHIKTKHFRVLTWRPRLPSVRNIFAAHLGQTDSIHADYIKAAWRNWKKLEAEQWKKAKKGKDVPALEVYGYDVVPTAIGVCNDRYIKIELLPFNPIWKKDNRRTADNRPALVISKASSSQRYECFRGWFEDFWLNAMLNAKQVHPRWRARREELLQKRGLTPSDTP
jgi:hypothetical protein